MKSLILVLSLTILGACSAFKGSLTGSTAAKSTANRHVATTTSAMVIGARLVKNFEKLRQLFREGRIPQENDIPSEGVFDCYNHVFNASLRDDPDLSLYNRVSLTFRRRGYRAGSPYGQAINAKEKIHIQTSISTSELWHTNYFTKEGVKFRYKVQGYSGRPYAPNAHAPNAHVTYEYTVTARLVEGKENDLILEYAFKRYGGEEIGEEINKRQYIKSDAVKGGYVDRYLYCKQR